ncbi:hypothetical protein [Acidocella aminolytica]|uniref:Uncharacterized protein n=1 Tax=Acidocella aminolytica 101 = DSM 11237 TaxID=1120923 RepID=A0A0D6PHD3_9PROT|nr:hypothetical protein [Acidocella aminolytica]GAN80239.1 hypothetical protein Aam_041_006 [Acidocella aminolytica 101 = DSM 11237]GBQ44597.1 hypothetical protein AA11237_3542 [Acidocella aminolytica 101 = DSM 11237]SHE92390.1 hypothetical protein SAMN02746095_01585 [Acidocella aminolytica 101 = DSM 11237]
MVSTGETLAITSPYSVATNLTFANEGTQGGVIILSCTGISAGTETINGTLSSVADFGGGIIANMFLSVIVITGL